MQNLDQSISQCLQNTVDSIVKCTPLLAGDCLLSVFMLLLTFNSLVGELHSDMRLPCDNSSFPR